MPADSPLQLLKLESPANARFFDAVQDKSEPIESALDRELKTAKLTFTADDRATIRRYCVEGYGDRLSEAIAKAKTPAERRKLLDSLGQAQTRGEADKVLSTGVAPRDQYAPDPSPTGIQPRQPAPPPPAAAKPAPPSIPPKSRVTIKLPTNGPKL